MDEQLTENQQPRIDATVATGLGSIAVIERPEDASAPSRDVQIGKFSYSTNLPEGIDIFEDGPEDVIVSRRYIVPSSLDQLPLGANKITRRVKDTGEGTNFEYDEGKVINIRTTEYGRVVDVNSFRDPIPSGTVLGGTDKLMTALGYVVNQNENGSFIEAVPTPETVKHTAAQLGVDVELFPGAGLIDGHDYLKTISEGKFPVAEGSEYYFVHDITDDHLTTMVLGGEPLKTAIGDVAGKALASDEEVIGQVTGRIDEFTATLRAIVAPSEITGYAYGREAGRSTLHGMGRNLGLSDETIAKILTTAQDNARKYGLDVKELD